MLKETKHFKNGGCGAVRAKLGSTMYFYAKNPESQDGSCMSIQETIGLKYNFTKLHDVPTTTSYNHDIVKSNVVLSL
jgi:hypothetical protein